MEGLTKSIEMGPDILILFKGTTQRTLSMFSQAHIRCRMPIYLIRNPFWELVKRTSFVHVNGENLELIQLVLQTL